MINEILKRDVSTRYGIFHFELVEYPGPSPLIDIYFNTEHLGYARYVNLSEATEYELLNLTYNIEYPVDYDY